MTPFILVSVTASSSEEAEKIAKELVDSRLAACVQISGPVRSFYRWNGSLENTKEFQLFIKTSSANFENLSARIRALHSYEIPEILSIPIANGLPQYLDWMAKEISEP
jgi:periplasmic divalent cation tolerance protein